MKRIIPVILILLLMSFTVTIFSEDDLGSTTW